MLPIIRSVERARKSRLSECAVGSAKSLDPECFATLRPVR